jgi:uncharacterized protein (DUF2252 family)
MEFLIGTLMEYSLLEINRIHLSMASITERIIEFNADRDQHLIRYKYDAMEENIYRFYRATNHIFYEDLAQSPPWITSPAGWICGDLHLENFGSYKGENRLVYFDLNDFDEAVLAPVHWEISRLIASIFVAFKHLKIDGEKANRLAKLFLKNYSDTLKAGKAVYIERQVANGIVCEFLNKANGKTHKDVIKKKTEVHKKKLIKHFQEWLGHDENTPYNYTVTDAAFRKAGTASLGLKRYVLLLRSNNKAGARYMLLDMKQAAPASPARYVDISQPQWNNESERVTSIQQQTQNTIPAMLSCMKFENNDYIIQELQPEKDSINFKLLKDRYRDMCRVIADMGTLTAAGQLRTAGRMKAAGPDDLIAFGNEVEWHDTIINYGMEYSKKVALYYNEFCGEID